MKKLGERNYLILSGAIANQGTFNPQEVLSYCEELLECSQVEEIEKFLTWVYTNNKFFGRKNYEDVFADFKDSQIGDN